MEEFVTANDQSELFEVEGQLAEVDAIFLEETTGIGSVTRSVGEIATPFRAKSYISIGVPIVHSFAKILATQGESITADIQLQTKQYEFYYTELTCSFDAGPGCRFHDARFALELQTVPSNPNNDAIAYDLFPLKVEDESKVSIKRSLSLQFTFSPDPSLSAISLPLYEGSEEYITYKGHIEAFDLRGTQPAWRFVRTHVHEIGGAYKLFMIIRKPKGSSVKAILSLTAHVQFMVGMMPLDPLPLVMFFRYGKNQPVIDKPTIPLC